jgi:hypothetical protein
MDMDDYIFRNATLDDVSFLADVIIAAEKSSSDKLGFSSLFNLPEEKVKELIISMLSEEVDGCEFSINGYLIAEYKSVPVGSLGGWIEGFRSPIPSRILKSNLLSYTFPPESLQCLKEKSYLVQDMYLERENLTLQLEYAFVKKEHRGNNLIFMLMKKLIERALIECPELKKVQAQCYKNNTASIHILSNFGFKEVKKAISEAPEVLDYLPFNTKIMMEMNIQ